jgi:hypothetical protein
MSDRSSLFAATTLLVTSVFAAAYGYPGSDSAARLEGHGVVPDFAASGTEAVPPDTTAEALWRHLQAEDYRRNWKLWPGKGQLYSGTEPHGMLLTTYANDIAQQALAKGQVTGLPAGSIIVKENYMPDSAFAAATVMYKVDGYNPDHQNWLFAKYDPKGNTEAFGRAPMCQACHQGAKSGAYIFTPVPR